MLVSTCTTLLSFCAYVVGTCRSLYSQKLYLGFTRLLLAEAFQMSVASDLAWGLDLAPRFNEENGRRERRKERQEEQCTTEPAVALRTKEVGATIFSAKNIKISNDRLGLTRSAILLVLFIVIHAVGNLHVFKGQRLRIWMHLDGFCCKLHESFFQLLSVSDASLVSPVNL